MATHPGRIPGLHTPTQSFSEPSGEAAASAALAQGISVADKKKLKEEIDLAKSRLTDQKFNIRDYPDPLLPREGQPLKPLPHGHTAETEQHLVGVLAKLKAELARA